jgi:hypothetical protein
MLEDRPKVRMSSKVVAVRGRLFYLALVHYGLRTLILSKASMNVSL